MWQSPRAYPFLAVVEFNMSPVVPGRGSGIFLHAQTGGPTIGCISLRKPELRAVLRWLHPAGAPVIAIGDVERTVVVVHSISMDVPDQLIPVFPAYEERFLCLVLSLLRSRKSRVVYVTSQPILPRLIDYYFGLVPELDTPEARSRFSVVSLVDGRNLPLTKKLLSRPGAIERIRTLVAQPELAFVLPFATSPDEVELAGEAPSWRSTGRWTTTSWAAPSASRTPRPSSATTSGRWRTREA